MQESSPPIPEISSRAGLDVLFEHLRPALHRYCARLVGSAVDGEDVLQEAVLKAIEAWSDLSPPEFPDRWLFRIAHNTGLDFLRRSRRYRARHEAMDLIKTSAAQPNVLAVRTSLQVLSRLPVLQRSAVILRDVLEFSIEEVAEILARSVPAIKGALQRGRARIDALARSEAALPRVSLSETEERQLRLYIDRFNAHDFDAIRTMLAEDVRLDLVNRLKLRGRDDVAPYFHRYEMVNQWRFAAGTADARPAVLAFDIHDPSGKPRFFIDLVWRNGKIERITDFLFASYVLESADIRV